MQNKKIHIITAVLLAVCLIIGITRMSACKKDPGFDGKWYEDGKPDGNYYIFSGKTYKLCNTASGDDQPLETGTYAHFNNSVSHPFLPLDSGKYAVTMLHLKTDSGDDPTVNLFYASGDNLVLQSQNTTKLYKFYIRESAIGTPEGDGDILKHALMGKYWRYTGDDGSFKDIYFMFPNEFETVVNGQVESVGTYDITDGHTINLSFSDGNIDTATASDALDSITFGSNGNEYTCSI